MIGTERFRAWRESTGESQAEVAKRIGVHQTMVGFIERGERRPNVDIAVAIERETKDWSEGPILVTEWVREPVESEPEAAA